MTDSIKDSSRHNLVTRFACANCGEIMRLSYGKPPSAGYQPEAHHGITGADMVEVTVAVHPCAKCYGEARAPIEALQKALKAAL